MPRRAPLSRHLELAAARARYRARNTIRAARAALARPPWLRLAGFGALTAGAWNVSTTLGLVVAGVALLLLEWSVSA